jgi:hypothetical protein
MINGSNKPSGRAVRWFAILMAVLVPLGIVLVSQRSVGRAQSIDPSADRNRNEVVENIDLAVMAGQIDGKRPTRKPWRPRKKPPRRKKTPTATMNWTVTQTDSLTNKVTPTSTVDVTSTPTENITSTPTGIVVISTPTPISGPSRTATQTRMSVETPTRTTTPTPSAP